MTIGFSHKGNFWTSRYSFEPDSYGSVDNELLSFKSVSIQSNQAPPNYGGGNRLCWRHRNAYLTNNDSYSYNNFFSAQGKSSVEFLCNDNPSMEKFFKSISIESNQNIFTSTIRTNSEVADNYGYKLQVSYAKDFVNKEEALYSDFRYSITNSTSHYNYCGYIIPDVQLITSLTADPPILGPSLTKVYKFGKFFSFNTSNPMPRANTVITEDMSDIEILNKFSHFSTCAIALETVNDFFALAVNTSSDNNYPFTGDSFTSPNILGKYYNYFVGSDDNLYLMTSSGVSQYIQADRIGVMKVCPPEFYGDQMRGKYAKIIVSQVEEEQSSPFEIYGFNIGYEQSHLDSE